MIQQKITQNSEGTFLQIKVIANASENKIEETSDFFKVKIKAPAVDNKANQALVKFFSEVFNISKNNIKIVSGEKSSRKTVFIKNYFTKLSL